MKVPLIKPLLRIYQTNEKINHLNHGLFWNQSDFYDLGFSEIKAL